MLPHNTPDWHNFSYYMVTLTHKKGAGVCSFAHPGILGLRIASPHRIDNAYQPTPERTIYNELYRNAQRRRLGCHLSAVAMKLRSSRCTTTDVRKRLSHI